MPRLRLSLASLLDRKALLLVCLTCAFPGCDDTSSAYCSRDTDCPLSERCADGVCTPQLAVVDRGMPDALGDRGGTDLLGDLALEGSAKDSGLNDGGACQGNADDVITAKEMPVEIGGKVAYTIGTKVMVDLAGVLVAGRRRWRLVGKAPDDKRVVSELLPLFAWAKPKFKTATYAALLDSGQGAYGVFEVAPAASASSALSLLGVVSEKPVVPFSSGIELAYDKPIEMLRFPISAATQYKSSANASGYFNGPWLYVAASYDVSVVAAGSLELPDITFDVLLVRTTITQVPYANPLLVKKRTVFLFIAECYGIVGRVVASGVPGDLSAVVADERWRLSF